MVPCKSWVAVERPSRWQLSIDPGLSLVNEMRESEFADTLRRKVQSSRLVVVFPAVGPNTCSMASPGLKVVRRSGYWLSLNLSTEEERLRDGPGDHRHRLEETRSPPATGWPQFPVSPGVIHANGAIRIAQPVSEVRPCLVSFLRLFHNGKGLLLCVVPRLSSSNRSQPPLFTPMRHTSLSPSPSPSCINSRFAPPIFVRYHLIS